MSKISERIRADISDPSVGGDYGAWGILSPDQRRKIRELCDVCDEFERTVDALMKERSEVADEIFTAVGKVVQKYYEKAENDEELKPVEECLFSLTCDLAELANKYLNE